MARRPSIDSTFWGCRVLVAFRFTRWGLWGSHAGFVESSIANKSYLAVYPLICSLLYAACLVARPAPSAQNACQRRSGTLESVSESMHLGFPTCWLCWYATLNTPVYSCQASSTPSTVETQLGPRPKNPLTEMGQPSSDYLEHVYEQLRKEKQATPQWLHHSSKKVGTTIRQDRC